MVGPNYQSPESPTPAQWTSSLARGETNVPVDLAIWWKNFNDTNLDSLMVTAVQSNLTLRIAEARVREARAERTVVSGALWPSLNASGGYSRNRFGQNQFPPLAGFPGVNLDYNLYNADFDAAWELDVFGGTRRAIEAANAQIGVAEYSETNVLISLLAEVARNYINARAYQQRLRIAQENINVEQDSLDLTTNRAASGLSSDLDVQQASALLNATEAEVPSLQTGFDESVFHLAVLLGQPPGALMDRMSARGTHSIDAAAGACGFAVGFALSPARYSQAEWQLAAATAQIGVATADLYPKFSLTGLVGLQSVSANNWFEYASRYWKCRPDGAMANIRGGEHPGQRPRPKRAPGAGAE